MSPCSSGVRPGGRSWARKAGAILDWPTAPDDEPPVMIGEDLVMTHPAEAERGVYMPVQIYPMFETVPGSSNGRTPDVGAMPNMLQRVLQEDAVARNLVYHQLRCTIEPADLVQNVQTRVTLQVENPSEANLGQVLLHVRGPRTGLEINPDRVDLTLNSHTVLTVDLSMAALREGDFAVEVLILQQNTEVPSSSLPVHHLWIHASRPRGTSS